MDLSLKRPLGTLDNQREMYKLCPALDTLSPGDAGAENFGILAVSPQSKLCPVLRHLTLHEFALLDDGHARVFEDFCSSRGLAPFSTTLNSSAGSLFQLDRITVYMDDNHVISSFRRHCLRLYNMGYETFCFGPLTLRLSLSMSIPHESVKEHLEHVSKVINTETPYHLSLLEVCIIFFGHSH